MRVGYDIDSQSSGSLFRFEEGNGEIVDAWVTNEIVQEYGTKCGIMVSVQRLDKNWKATDDEPINELLSVGPVDKFHPAQADTPDDKDPQDLGSDDDVRGNCFIAVGGKAPDRKAKISIFGKSLQEKGMKPELLNGYAPNLIGLKAHFGRQVLEKGEGYTGKNDPTALIVHKIVTYPKGGKAPAPAKAVVNGAPRPATRQAAKPAVPAPAAAPAAAPEPPVSADTGVGAEVEETALGVLAYIGEQNPGQVLTRQKLYTKLVTALLRQVPDKNQHKPVSTIIKNPDWLDAQLAELGWNVAGDNFTVPAA